MKRIFSLVLFGLVCKYTTERVVEEEVSDDERFDKENKLMATDQFEAFIQTFNKTYWHETEKAERFEIFLDNLERIKAIQKDDRGTAIYGITKFADLTADEFKRKFLRSRSRSASDSKFDHLFTIEKENESNYNETGDPPPKPIFADWTRTSISGRIYEQGYICGSCYALASISMVEFLVSKKYKKQIYLSAQFIIDCTRICCGNGGCEGGWVEGTMKALRLYGVPPESAYPYVEKESTCKKIDPTKVPLFKIIEAFKITSGEKRIFTVLPKSPVLVTIDGKILQFYKKGVIAPTEEECSKVYVEETSHLMLVVGDGIEDNTIFFKVRNTYGKNWGEEGHMRFKAFENACGIGNDPWWAKV